MRKRDRLEVDVTTLDDEGAGLGDHLGVRVHIAGALPGERVRATVAHLSPHRPDAWATLESIARASSDRVVPACPAYGACGGCVLEHLAYPAQVAWKGARVAERLSGFAPVAACVPSPRALGYRNRAKLVYGGGALLGGYAPRSHELVDLAGCRVAEPPLDEVARALGALLLARAVAAYDEQRGEGVLRYVVLRANAGGEVHVTLVTASEWSGADELARALIAARPEVAGVVENVNPSRGNFLYGEFERVLAGRAAIEERVGAVRLRLSSTAFFQVNREQAARLYADVLASAELDGSERVVDGYAGVGGIALTLAPHAREVIGLESVRASVADAEASSALNGLDNVRFICCDTAAGLTELAQSDGGADVVVLNPPRRGCAPEVLAAAARLAPRRILYVSCDPETLARDLALLDGHGYRALAVTPYDMIPETPHVEALAVLVRLKT